LAQAILQATLISAVLLTAPGPGLASQRCKVTDPTGTPLNVRRFDGKILGVLHNGEIVKVLRDEQPEPLLDDLSEHATLLVVGAGWEGRLASLVFGSVSAHLQAHGRCPVVTVPPEWIGRPASERPLIVVGIEPSAGGLEAMEFAMTYAEATGSKVLAIRCWERADAVDSRDPLAERDLQRLLLDGIVADAVARHPFVQVAKQVTPGPVHDALRLAALSADLIVIGTRYPTGVKGSRLGPIAARLTRRMPCPVAVVSPPGAEPPIEFADPEPSYANGA